MDLQYEITMYASTFAVHLIDFMLALLFLTAADENLTPAAVLEEILQIYNEIFVVQIEKDASIEIKIIENRGRPILRRPNNPVPTRLIPKKTAKEFLMVHFEETFMNFLLHHQERHNRTHHFLILMDAIISAAKHIQHYYLTGALKGNLGLAGRRNVQGEDVMRMDQIANEIAIHYLKASGRVIHAISEESKEIIPLDPESGRYFVYFDPLDGSSNIPTACPSASSSAWPSGTSTARRTATFGRARISSPPACSSFPPAPLRSG